MPWKWWSCPAAQISSSVNHHCWSLWNTDALMCSLLKPNTLHSTLSYSRARQQTEYYMKRERKNKRCFNMAHLQRRAFWNNTVMVTMLFFDVNRSNLPNFKAPCFCLRDIKQTFLDVKRIFKLCDLLTVQGLYQSYNRLFLRSVNHTLSPFVTVVSTHPWLGKSLQTLPRRTNLTTIPCLFWDYDFVCSAAGWSIR